MTSKSAFSNWLLVIHMCADKKCLYVCKCESRNSMLIMFQTHWCQYMSILDVNTSALLITCTLRCALDKLQYIGCQHKCIVDHKCVCVHNI